MAGLGYPPVAEEQRPAGWPNRVPDKPDSAMPRPRARSSSGRSSAAGRQAHDQVQACGYALGEATGQVTRERGH